jgi:hypothetical protein
MGRERERSPVVTCLAYLTTDREKDTSGNSVSVVVSVR